jgi:hypothetical protein
MTLSKKLFSILVLSSIFFLIIVSIEIFFFKKTETSHEDIYMEKSHMIDSISDDEKQAAQDILAQSLKKEVQEKEKIQNFLEKKRQEAQNKKLENPVIEPKKNSYTLSYFPEELHLQTQ